MFSSLKQFIVTCGWIYLAVFMVILFVMLFQQDDDEEDP